MEGTNTAGDQPNYREFGNGRNYRQKRDDHIRERRDTAKLPLRELSDEFGLSKSHVHRIIQKSSGADESGNDA